MVQFAGSLMIVIKFTFIRSLRFRNFRKEKAKRSAGQHERFPKWDYFNFLFFLEFIESWFRLFFDTSVLKSVILFANQFPLGWSLISTVNDLNFKKFLSHSKIPKKKAKNPIHLIKLYATHFWYNKPNKVEKLWCHVINKFKHIFPIDRFKRSDYKTIKIELYNFSSIQIL